MSARICKTPLYFMTDPELVRHAEQVVDTLPPIGIELLERLRAALDQIKQIQSELDERHRSDVSYNRYK